MADKPPIHGGAPWPEYTACGFAFDAFASVDVQEELVMAEPGQTVTCEHCLNAIAYYKSFKRNRQP
jgi:hypothetical protein